MPPVYTYHEPVQGLPPAGRLLELWKKNWTEFGFEPVILSEKDAREHPGFSYFVERISRYPTSNPPAYERACFVRHLALANVGGGLLVDYDVICREPCFPGDIDKFPDHPVLLEPTRVPCAVLGSAKAFEDLCDVLCEFNANGEKHVSDMTIIRKTRLQSESICIEHLCSGSRIENDPGDGWKAASMIHFSNYSFSKLGWRGDKAELIERVLKTLPPISTADSVRASRGGAGASSAVD